MASKKASPPAPAQPERSAILIDSLGPVCAICGGPRSPRKREACSDACRTALNRQRKAERFRQALLDFRARIDSMLERL